MDQPHLLLLPGLLNDARLWRGVINGLNGAAHCTVADLTVADTMPALAAAVLAGAPAERFALAGLSMGGYVALEIMRQAPGRVAALALLDTTARPDTPQATEGRRDLMRRAETDFASVPDALLPKMVHPLHLKDGAVGGLFVKMALGVGGEAFIRQERAILGRIDSRPWLRRIQCPALVLCGREDALTPVELHEEMAAAIPGARLEIIEECGHLSALERPARVTEALKGWIPGATKS